MKHKLLLVALFAVSFSNAQSLSVGPKSGISYWRMIESDVTDYSTSVLEKTPFITWDKGLFFRYETKRVFAIELAFNHYSFDSRKWSALMYGWDATPVNFETVYYRSKDHIAEASLLFQWKINPRSKHWNIYLGPEITYGRHYQRYEHYYYSIGNDVTREKGIRDSEFQTGIGANTSVQYRFNKNWYLQTQVAARYTNMSGYKFYAAPFDSDQLLRYNLHIGLGYRL